MAVEVGAGQSAVPRPVVLGVRGGMHADVSAARLDVALEDILLRRIQHLPRRTQEDDGAVARQVLLRKSAGVLSRVDRKPMLLSELAYGGDAVGSGVVTESGGLGKDEHVRLLRRCGDRGGIEIEARTGSARETRSRCMGTNLQLPLSLRQSGRRTSP